MRTNICTTILKTLKDYDRGAMKLQDLVRIVNPELSFSAALTDGKTYKKIQEMIILENLLVMRDQGLVLLNENQETILRSFSEQKISTAEIKILQ